MQSQSPIGQPNVWLDFARSPAAVLIALSLSFRLILWPAMVTLFRRAFHREFQQVEKIPELERRVTTVEKAIETLAGVPQQLEHIRTLLEERTGR